MMQKGAFAIACFLLVIGVVGRDCDKVCNPQEFPHKGLTPMDGDDWLTFCLSALAILLAAGGGIGGGGMLVPIYILIGNFTAKEAVPLSNLTILGGSIANTIFNFMKKHPYEENPPPGRKPVCRPRIDFDIVNVMEPMTIAGAVLGSLINKVLPGWLLTLLLMVILGAITIKTTFSGMSKWKNENIKRARIKKVLDAYAQANPSGGEPDKETLDKLLVDEIRWEKEEAARKAKEEADETTKLKVESGGLGGKEYDATYDALDAEEKLKVIEDYETVEALSFPPFKLSLLAFVWIGVNVLDLFRGGGGYKGPFDINCGDVGYWIFTFLYIPFTVAVASYVALYLMRDTKIKHSIGYPWVEGDVQWNMKRSIVFPLICSTAGIFAGMFGVGGGIVKGPLMNEMGVLPEVTQATAAFMIFFTASAATVSYALYGMIIWSYGIVLTILGFVVTAIGQIIVFWVVEKLGRPSIIVFVIGAILGASCVLLGYNGITTFIATMDCNCDISYNVC